MKREWNYSLIWLVTIWLHLRSLLVIPSNPLKHKQKLLCVSLLQSQVPWSHLHTSLSWLTERKRNLQGQKCERHGSSSVQRRFFNGLIRSIACLGSRSGQSQHWRIWIPESCALESWIELKESGIPLTIGIQNPSSTDKKSGIESVESRIQDCLGFRYMGQCVLWRQRPILVRFKIKTKLKDYWTSWVQSVASKTLDSLVRLGNRGH